MGDLRYRERGCDSEASAKFRSRAILAQRCCCGGSVIAASNSRIIAGPMGAEEGILYAECNLELGINMKLRHDFASHYNRADFFQLQVNRGTPHIYSVVGTEEQHTAAAAIFAPGGRRAARCAPMPIQAVAAASAVPCVSISRPFRAKTHTAHEGL